DRIPPALVHGPAIFGEQRRIPKTLPERRTVLQHRGHGQEAIEPVAELAWEGFADPIGRVPGTPGVTVSAVAQRAETDNTGVEPGVSDIGDALHGRATRGAGNLDGVNVRSVRCVPLKRLPSLDRPRRQFVLVPNDLIVAAGGTFPEGESQTPI